MRRPLIRRVRPDDDDNNATTSSTSRGSVIERARAREVTLVIAAPPSWRWRRWLDLHVIASEREEGGRQGLTFAGLAMRDRSRRVPVVTLAAVMTVPPRREMSALKTNASADTARQLVQLHVESTLSRVEVAVAH